MKHLKSYKVFEADFFAADNFDEIKSYLEDIFLEITDEGFSVDIVEPNLGNMYRLKISIIRLPGENAIPFKLEDIKHCVESIYDYLESLNVNYYLDQIDGSGPSFKNYREIRISKDTNDWDLSQELVMLDLFFDKDERNYEMGGMIQKFNESVNQNWSEVDGKLCRDFQFSDFNESLQFINKISEICESENHHPEINWVYNKITLKLSTHDAVDIITEKDIKLAELIDEVA